MERKFWVKISRNITSRGCPLFRKLWKLYSSLEISGTSKQAAFHSTIFEKFRFAFHGISSSEWNSSRFPRYPVPQLQIPQFYLPRLLGSSSLIRSARFSPVPFFTLDFPRFQKLEKFYLNGKRELLVHNGWLCFKILWLTKTRRIVEWVIWLKSSWAAIIELWWVTSRADLIFPQLKQHANLFLSCQQNGQN